MMNYIEFEIGGKVRGFKMGLGFLGDLLRHYDTDMMGLGQILVKNPFSATPVILYIAHKHDCIRKENPIDFQLHDVEDWIDEMEDTLNNKHIEELMLIMFDAVKKHLPKLEEEGSKKK